MPAGVNQSVFLDTSGLYPVFDRDDCHHREVTAVWHALLESEAPLFTSNYVLVELAALLERRLGVAAVDALATFVLPAVRTEWVDEQTHQHALTALLTTGKRELSLVDCTTYVVMRRLEICAVLAVDGHFAAQGFVVIPRL